MQIAWSSAQAPAAAAEEASVGCMLAIALCVAFAFTSFAGSCMKRVATHGSNKGRIPGMFKFKTRGSGSVLYPLGDAPNSPSVCAVV